MILKHAPYLLSTCLLVGSGLTGCKPKATADAATTQELPPVAVKTAAVTELEVPLTLRLTGTLKGDQETDLAANATGRVLAASVERGQTITRGDVLARLDVRALTLSATEAKAQAASVGAQEAQAKLECDRYQALKDKGAVTALEYDAKMTQCRTLPLSAEAAQVRAQLAAQNVGDGIIRAPFSGVVTERYVEVGQYLRQDSRVATLVSIDPLRLELAVPEAEVARVTPGAEVSFGVSAYPGRRFTGKVRFISGALRSATRDLVVEAMVDNADKVLKPGMFADVSLSIGTQRLPSVPKQSVVVRDERSRAFFLVNGQLEERILALGPELGDRVSVKKGAALSDVAVVGDVSGLHNGQRAQ
jgi:membrane fusion protein, multidrug efflux system